MGNIVTGGMPRIATDSEFSGLINLPLSGLVVTAKPGIAGMHANPPSRLNRTSLSLLRLSELAEKATADTDFLRIIRLPATIALRSYYSSQRLIHLT
ncbi:hypothetical protein EYB25_009715 [Talaromyces marneffei]|nr:hypothetical protein EYB25_009715 [Talaromyces marneffei]